MIQPPYSALEIGMLVVGVPAAAALGVSQLALAVVADRVEKQVKALGGDPPLGGGMNRSPEFWEYVRKWRDRHGDEQLRRSVRTADILLNVRMVSFPLCLLVLVLQFFA